MPEPMRYEMLYNIESEVQPEVWDNELSKTIPMSCVVEMLNATLAQRREGVTAAMVEAACVAMFQWWKLSTTTHADRELARLDMRAALTAALGARDGGAD